MAFSEQVTVSGFSYYCQAVFTQAFNDWNKKKKSNQMYMYLSIFMSSLEVWLLPAVKFNPINNKLSQLRLYCLDAISSLK
jgi:hypothetical protein